MIKLTPTESGEQNQKRFTGKRSLLEKDGGKSFSRKGDYQEQSRPLPRFSLMDGDVGSHCLADWAADGESTEVTAPIPPWNGSSSTKTSPWIPIVGSF